MPDIGILPDQCFRNRDSLQQKELLSELVKLNDNGIQGALNNQWIAKDNQYYGAVFDGDSVVSPIGTAHFIQNLMCSYVSPDSKYYKSKEILQRLTLAAQGLLNLQHEDGTIDLISTNFHSTPDLGFTIYPLGLAYSIMLKNNKLNYGELPSTMKKYFLNAGESAFSRRYPHTQSPLGGFRRIGLDCTFPLIQPIGPGLNSGWPKKWTLIQMASTTSEYLRIYSRDQQEPDRNGKRMNLDYLYEDVRKNLNLTFYFVHSNGEIATESSNRQDKYHVSNMAGYYLAYNYMALHDKDSRFAGNGPLHRRNGSFGRSALYAALFP